MKLNFSAGALAFTLAILGAGTSWAAEVRLAPADGTEKLIETLIMAEEGDTILLEAGRWDIADGLVLDADGVTIRGAGAEETVLSFKGQTGSGEGLLVTSDSVVLEDFAVEDTKGDGIKSKGSDRITFRNLRVEWTNGPDEKNGAYGVYPVSSTNVLIEGVTVRGASDAGIYVGQSQDIIVRNSLAEYNVAGIEIENCYRADVYGNMARHNTGGILIFDLPNLPQQGGHDIRVFDNSSIDNDTPNFAPAGNIVGSVPMGTGIMVMANRNVHIFGNRLSGNGTVHVLVAAYPNDYDDDNYMFVPRGVFIHDNSYGEGGAAPDNEIGELLAERAGTPIPDIVWDGVTRIPEWFTWVAAENRIYVKEAEGTTFANAKMISHMLLPWETSPDRDIADYEGSLPEPAAVTLPQDMAQDMEG
ncbi:parallel beta-helix domain-containing protein [Parvibaculum sp.]|uniref:parallel beta-helix domain-containing protein n=1 Tax=Parvibaculum sp. TaxID=2024848 RepID=UPI003BAB29A7